MQEKIVGGQIFMVFGLGMLLVYLLPGRSSAKAGSRRSA